MVWFYSSYLRGRSQLRKVNDVLSDAWRAARICAGSTSVYYIYNSTQLDNNSIWSETSPFCWRHTNLHRIYNEVVNYITKCVMAIHVWMDQNMLKLNPNKTEFMVIENINKRIIAGHLFRVELLNRHFAEIDSGCTCSIWSRPFVQKNILGCWRSASFALNQTIMATFGVTWGFPTGIKRWRWVILVRYHGMCYTLTAIYGNGDLVNIICLILNNLIWYTVWNLSILIHFVHRQNP